MPAFSGILRSMFPHTVIVEMCSSANSDGEYIYQTCASYRAAIQGPQKFLHSVSAQELVSRQTVYVGTTAPMALPIRVTLPSGYDVRQPPVMDFGRVSDERGFHHVKLYLG